MLDQCEQVMRHVCEDMGAELREFNGEDDHVHLLVHYPPKLAISTLVNRLKGTSAHYLRKQFPKHVRRFLWGNRLWSPSHFAASCGGGRTLVSDRGVHRPAKTPGRAVRAG